MSNTNAAKIDKLLGTSTTVENKKSKTNLVQMSYYITPEIRKAIALRAATDDTDKSSIVRAALIQYLGIENE